MEGVSGEDPTVAVQCFQTALLCIVIHGTSATTGLKAPDGTAISGIGSPNITAMAIIYGQQRRVYSVEIRWNHLE